MDSFNSSWDNKWYSEAKILDDRWVCEFAIPFKTIRYKEFLSTWNINFYRNDTNQTEQSTWSPISRASARPATSGRTSVVATDATRTRCARAITEATASTTRPNPANIQGG